jgi:quercetin dioxygenase-like cupin family protein
MRTTTIDRSTADNDPTIDHTHFSGDVSVQSLVGSEESSEIELLAVFFKPGARTRPHIHERDQVLHFIEGRGLVATENEKQFAGPGDIITMVAGVWHWHGATRDRSACHISVKQPGPTNWEVDEGNWASGYDD